jgi:hypothetical protein
MITDPLLGFVTGLDSATAWEIQRFFDEILRDRQLMQDLTVSSMQRLEDGLQGGDHPRIHCYVSVSPAPRFGFSHPLARLLYRRLYGATSSGLVSGAVPRGTTLGGDPLPLLADPRSNDGVVPASSQTLDGSAAGIVCGDRLDVVGHFAGGPGATVFKSDAGFDEARFDALWADIARRLVGP